MKKRSYLTPEPSNAPKYIGILLLSFFIFALGWNVGINHASQTQNPFQADQYKNSGRDAVDMQLFWDTWSILSGKYVDPSAIDYREMVYGAIHGMVASLNDPYTAFMTPKENKEFQNSLDGTLEGIGAEITLRNGMLTVVSPLKDSPAQLGGLQPEDIIYKIEGELAEDYTLEQSVMKIRGPKGTPVTLTIIRKGKNDPFDVKIVRDEINVSSVEFKMMDDIAVIELNQFGNHSKEEFNKAISQMLTQGAKGLVLDLRYNGGGFLDGAVDVVSEFVDKGQVVSVKQRNPEQSEVIFVNGKARVTTIPMMVLVNRGSASASEIVAGALQDHGRAKIIGETTFGKGTVQEVVSLIGGSSLRVTVAKWFTPNGNSIDQTGIEPDIKIERTIEDFEKNRDPQMDKAIELLK